MLNVLDELRNEVDGVNPTAVETLRPGLSGAEIRRRLKALPFAISADAVALYEWADGADGLFELLPGGYFIPLAQALDEFAQVYPVIQAYDAEYLAVGEEGGLLHQPYHDCFRFLSDRSAGGYAFGRVDSPSEGQIVGLCIHAQWQIAFRDLEHLLRTSIECYRRGVIGVNGEFSDFYAFTRIAAQLNPGLGHWTFTGDELP